MRWEKISWSRLKAFKIILAKRESNKVRKDESKSYIENTKYKIK